MPGVGGLPLWILPFIFLFHAANVLSQEIRRRATWPITLVAVLLAVRPFPGMASIAEQAAQGHGGGGVTVLDRRLFYTPGGAFDLLTALGEEGRSSYWWFCFSGNAIIPPLLQCVCLLCLVERLYPGYDKWESPLAYLYVLPIFALLFRLAENASVVMLLNVYSLSSSRRSPPGRILGAPLCLSVETISGMYAVCHPSTIAVLVAGTSCVRPCGHSVAESE